MNTRNLCRWLGFVIGLPLMLPGEVSAQANQPLPDSLQKQLWSDSQITHSLEQFPELPGGGGTAAIIYQLTALLKVPAEVRDGTIDGRLFVRFIVEPDGTLSNTRVIVGLSAACDAAALAALAQLPRFIPGRRNGRLVSVPLTLPINFYAPNHAYEAGSLALKHPARFPLPGVKTYIHRKLRHEVDFKQATQFGELQISYVVGADGQVRDAHLESTPGDEPYGQELLRLVQAMPAWRPARNAQNQAVAMRAYLQVRLPRGRVSTGRPSFTPRDLRN